MTIAIFGVGLGIGKDAIIPVVKVVVVPVFALVVVVGVFNRPKFLVPSHLRAEPDLFKDVFGGRNHR